MKKGQVFTIDLVIGTIIILGVLVSAYSITNYYLSINSSITTNGNFLSLVSSAVSSFSEVSSTSTALLQFQNGGSSSALSSYVLNILGCSRREFLNWVRRYSCKLVCNDMQ